MSYNRFIDPSSLREQQRLAGVEVTEAQGKYYVTREPKLGMYELRRARPEGRKKKHSMVAQAMTFRGLGSMMKVIGPEAEAAFEAYKKVHPRKEKS